MDTKQPTESPLALSERSERFGERGRGIGAVSLLFSGIALLAYGCCTAPPGVIDYSVTVATALCFVTACTLLNVELKLPALK